MNTSEPLVTEEHVRREVKRVIALVTDRNPEEIPDSALLADDLSVDSLAAMEILVDVERKYRITIPEGEFKKLRTVNDAVSLAFRTVQESNKAPAFGRD